MGSGERMNIMYYTKTLLFRTVIDAMRGMTKSGPIVYPNQDDADYHNKKYKVLVFLYCVDFP